MLNRAPRPTESVMTDSGVDKDELVPLSVLALDVDLPGGDLDVHLDDLGRRCLRRGDARRLITERREAAERQRKVAELQAIELDRQFRAQLRDGIPADQIPADVSPTAWLLQSAKDAAPRRESVLQHALRNPGAIVYHPIEHEDEP